MWKKKKKKTYLLETQMQLKPCCRCCLWWWQCHCRCHHCRSCLYRLTVWWFGRCCGGGSCWCCQCLFVDNVHTHDTLDGEVAVWVGVEFHDKKVHSKLNPNLNPNSGQIGVELRLELGSSFLTLKHPNGWVVNSASSTATSCKAQMTQYYYWSIHSVIIVLS